MGNKTCVFYNDWGTFVSLIKGERGEKGQYRGREGTNMDGNVVNLIV